MKHKLLLAFVAPMLAATSMKAPIFLELDGVKGESGGTNHAETIKIESFSWGATNTSSHGSGGGTGKAQFHDIHFTTRLSKATPQLLVACTRTNPIPHATLFVSESDTAPLDYYKISLENVLVTSLKQISAGVPATAASTNSPPTSGGDRPMETISLNFEKISLSYTAPDGTVTTGTAEQAPVR